MKQTQPYLVENTDTGTVSHSAIFVLCITSN